MSIYVNKSNENHYYINSVIRKNGPGCFYLLFFSCHESTLRKIIAKTLLFNTTKYSRD